MPDNRATAPGGQRGATRIQTRRRIGLGLASTLATMFLALVSGQVPERTLYLAIVRTDGLLVPFAVHHKGEWWNAWPFGSSERMAAIPIPKSVADMPKDWLPADLPLPHTWRMWPVKPGSARTVTVLGFARPESSQMEMIGVATDYPVNRSETERITVRDGDAGIALVGDATVGVVASVPADSTEWRAVLGPVVERVRSAERIAITHHIDELKRSGSAPARVQIATAETSSSQFVFTIQKTPHDGHMWYRVSAIREYFDRHSGPCSPRTEVEGILHQKAGEAPIVRSFSAFTSDGCHDPEELKLLGSLHWPGAFLWIVRVDIGGGFDYGLIDPGAADPHLLTMNGLWRLR